MSTFTHIVRASWCAIILTTGMLHPLSAQEYEVEPMPANSVYSDYGAVRFGDETVFCSNRTKMQLSREEESRLHHSQAHAGRKLRRENCSPYLHCRWKRLQDEALAEMDSTPSRLFRNERIKPGPTDIKG